MTRSVCYQFTANDKRMRLGAGKRTNDAIRIIERDVGFVLYGQYVSLAPGNYQATLEFHGSQPCRGSAIIDVCADKGHLVLASKPIDAHQIAQNGLVAAIEYSVRDPLTDVEVRLHSEGGFAADITGLEISGELQPLFCSLELDDLPPVPIENILSRGRSLYDGYRRGVGLQFTNLEQKILLDPDYNEARRLAGSRTILGELNLCNIFLIFKFYLPRLVPGHIVEFGSYRGGGAIFMASLARRFLPGCKIVGFDTFSGMPPTDSRVDHHQAGSFGEVDLVELRNFVREINLDNLEFIQGNFTDTAKPALKQLGSILFAHIDCDIRSAIQTAYDTTRMYMIRGGYWIFDDPMVSDCLGAAEAMEDLLIRRDGLNSEQIFPHYVFRQP